jgi:flagellar basal-body rod protein FlgG
MSKSAWTLLITNACITFAICFAVNGWWARELVRIGVSSHSSTQVSSRSGQTSISAISPQAQKVLENSIQVHREKLRVIANNISNADTIAFKRDCLVLTPDNYLAESLDGELTSKNELAFGGGVTISRIRPDFRQGPFKITERAFDVAIEGSGFFRVTDPYSGETCYTRLGSFSISSDGDLFVRVNTVDYLLEPSINIPSTATGVVIRPDGEVQYQESRSTNMNAAGSIELATFISEEGLRRNGCLFYETDESGVPQAQSPGHGGSGVLRQNALEYSNVDIDVERREFRNTEAQIAHLESVLSPDANLRR